MYMQIEKDCSNLFTEENGKINGKYNFTFRFKKISE
jgi:hypothetical protein